MIERNPFIFNRPPTPDLANMKGYNQSGISAALLAVRAHAFATSNLINRALEDVDGIRRGLVNDVAHYALGFSPDEIDGYVKADGTTSNRILLDHARQQTGKELVLCSPLAHASIAQAAGRSFSKIPLGDDLQMDQDVLLKSLNSEVGVLVLTADTTELGLIETLTPEIEKRCAELGIWIHVDAAYGGMNIGCLPATYPQHHTLRQLVHAEGVRSITTCPHKFVGPYGCSIAFLKKTDDAVEPAPLYLPGANQLTGTTVPTETAFKTRETMRRLGQSGLEELADMTMRSASYFSRVLAHRYDIRTIVPVQSGIVPIACRDGEAAHGLCEDLRQFGFNIAAPIHIQTASGDIHGVRIVLTTATYYDPLFLESLAEVIGQSRNG